MIINKYSTIIFDCDGVILNSNKIKSEAFYNVTCRYSKLAAEELVNYHKKNGGISRYAKFEFFINKIIPKHKILNKLSINILLEDYSKNVYEKLLSCEIAEGLIKMKELTSSSRWLVVSGSDQKELRNVLKKRNIADLFHERIYGSPVTKDSIFKRELENENIRFPALYIGDSRYDHIASKNNNLDFLFLYGWSEFKEWREYVKINNIKFFKNLSSILNDSL